MAYVELLFLKAEESDVSEILIARLGALGFESFAFDEDGLKAYVKEELFSREEIDQLMCEALFQGMNFQVFAVEQKNWNEVWESNFPPVIIDDVCLIRAPFHPPHAGAQYDIVMEPRMAFGTGHHATTALMVSKILSMDVNQKRVLDMGSGTAVLAMIAYKKGAATVVAVDNDEWAFRNALEHVERNHCPDIQVLLGGAEVLEKMNPFDVLLANINRNVLLSDIHLYAKKIISGGSMVLSGFYRDDEPIVTREAQKNGLSQEEISEKNNWVAVSYRKK